MHQNLLIRPHSSAQLSNQSLTNDPLADDGAGGPIECLPRSSY
jgi:hypothetical protein